MKLVKIKTISKIGVLETRYDIEVDSNHNYFANGILVHNCRCYITKDGAFSRNGKQWVATKFIEESLRPLFEKNPELILDGEMYTHALSDDFNKIVSLCKKTKNIKDKDWEEIEEKLEFHVFDLYYPKNKKLGSHDRYKLLKRLFDNDKYHNIVVVESIMTTKTDFHEHFQRFMEEGYEGIMLRDPDAPYECKRSYGLQKYKEFADAEYEIVDIEEGAGNRSGMFGRAILKTSNGKTFEANARGSFEFYRDLLQNKEKYIGKMATVRYQNETPDDGKGGGGVPRFGVIITIRDYEN